MKTIIFLLIFAQNLWANQKIKVVTSIPSIQSIVEEVGGDLVDVVSISKAKQNPHYVSVKPSFIKLVKKADLIVVSGLDLEVAWMPLLIRRSKNKDVKIGSNGYLDLSDSIQALQVIKGTITRKMGDVHGSGNPHYMVSPFRALSLVPVIVNRLIQIRPALKKKLLSNSRRFQTQLGDKIFGKKLVNKYPVVKLLQLHKIDKFDKFLNKTKQQNLLGGWMKTLRSYQNRNFFEDHSSYSYFMNDFSLNRVGALEPKSGINPSFRSLSKLILKMQETDTLAVFSSSFFPKKFLNFVANNSSAKIVDLSHQLGSRSKSKSYIEWVSYNVNRVTEVLGK